MVFHCFLKMTTFRSHFLVFVPTLRKHLRANPRFISIFSKIPGFGQNVGKPLVGMGLQLCLKPVIIDCFLAVLTTTSCLEAIFCCTLRHFHCRDTHSAGFSKKWLLSHSQTRILTVFCQFWHPEPVKSQFWRGWTIRLPQVPIWKWWAKWVLEEGVEKRWFWRKRCWEKRHFVALSDTDFDKIHCFSGNSLFSRKFTVLTRTSRNPSTNTG